MVCQLWSEHAPYLSGGIRTAKTTCMNNIKLSIFTGVEDTDIIELGLYNPSITGVMDTALGASFSGWVNGQIATAASTSIENMLADMNENIDRYAVFHSSDLLAAQDYLNKLKIACDT